MSTTSDTIGKFNNIFNEIYDELNENLGNVEVAKYFRPIELHKFFPSVDVVPVQNELSDIGIGGIRAFRNTFEIYCHSKPLRLNELDFPIDILDRVCKIIEDMRDTSADIITNGYADDIYINRIEYHYTLLDNGMIETSVITVIVESDP